MDVGTAGLFTIDGDGFPIFESQMAATTITYNRFRGPMQFQYGSTGQGITALFGADAISNGSTLTNVTTKVGRVGVPHYTNAEQNMCLFWGQSALNSTSIAYGGGSSLFNAAESHSFYTAANDITTTGTLRFQVHNSQIESYLTLDMNGNDVWARNTPQAAGYIQGSGTLSVEYGISSSVKNSTGNYTITLDASHGETYWAPSITPWGGAERNPRVSSNASTSVIVIFTNSAGAVGDSASLMVFHKV